MARTVWPEGGCRFGKCGERGEAARRPCAPRGSGIAAVGGTAPCLREEPVVLQVYTCQNRSGAVASSGSWLLVRAVWLRPSTGVAGAARGAAARRYPASSQQLNVPPLLSQRLDGETGRPLRLGMVRVWPWCGHFAYVDRREARTVASIMAQRGCCGGRHRGSVCVSHWSAASGFDCHV
jgi:hypothetical protein